MIRYYLKSRRQKDGTIKHEYSGRVNVNANIEEPHMQKFDDSSYQAHRMERMHEELMNEINPEIDKVKMIITEKPEKSFLARLLKAFTNWR